MRLGMMQPYFFPYLGYFGLIHATDCWIVFDTPQYIRRGWVNRNRVLSAGQQPWKYARIPVAKADPTAPIRDIRIDIHRNWRRDLLNQLDIYRLQKAPYYETTFSFLQQTLAYETSCLADMLTHCLNACCERLELIFPSRLFSAMDLDLPGVNHPGDWALETARALGASAYINPPGGRAIFEPQRFADAGVRLQFLEASLPAYSQRRADFIPRLSIIDVMMWNDIPTVRRMVADYQLRSA